VPPEVVCQDALATPSPPLPEVIRITESPVFGPDWALRSVSGYHRSARAYCAIPDDVHVPPVSDAPTAEDVARAKALILEDLLGDFPFEKPVRPRARRRAVPPAVRARRDQRGPTPLHVAESPTMGTGKGLLVDALLRPSCGRGVAVMAQCRDGDEWRKRITASLRGGHAAIQIDNVTAALDSGELAMALTISRTGRIGCSDRAQTVSYPVRCAWAMTANNPVLSTELARRSIRIRLDSKTDRPWEREQFRHKELMGWVDEQRGDLVWAGLTMIRSWVNAGMSAILGKSLGSFEAWSRIIGGILEHIRIEGFLGNLSEFYEVADTEGATWRSFVEGWWDQFGSERVGAASLFALAQSTEGMDLGHGNENSQKMVFGRALSKQRDRVIGDYTIKSAGTSKRLAQWKLVPQKDLLS
jgi:putative DNA primase/helicase